VLWDRILGYLVEQTRFNAGREASPTYGIIDFQSVKKTACAEGRGIDGGKTKGRKRRIVTDVMGNLLAIVVHVANIHDIKSEINPAREAFGRYPAIKKFCGDARYRKTFGMDVEKELDLGVDISQRIEPGWKVLPKRWVVERTLACEITSSSEEANVVISRSYILLKRL